MGIEEYVLLVGCRTRVIWIGNAFPPDIVKDIFRVSQTQARYCRIQSLRAWTNFIDSCYSLTCINEEEDWRSINGRKNHFVTWAQNDRVKNDPGYFVFDETKFVDPVFCTVFDDQKQKRLIVDGLHRAKALTEAYKEDHHNIPEVTIVECYGINVNMIFPCDIHQLPH